MTKYARYMREADRYAALAINAAARNEMKAIAFKLCAEDWEARAKKLSIKEAEK